MDVELKPKIPPQETAPDHSYINLPKGRVVEFFAADMKGTFYVVDRPKERGHMNMFHVYMGSQYDLKEVDVTGFDTYRDGGSIDIHFLADGQKGTLHFPTSLRVGAKPHVRRAVGEIVELVDLL